MISINFTLGDAAAVAYTVCKKANADNKTTVMALANALERLEFEDIKVVSTSITILNPFLSHEMTKDNSQKRLTQLLKNKKGASLSVGSFNDKIDDSTYLILIVKDKDSYCVVDPFLPIADSLEGNIKLAPLSFTIDEEFMTQAVNKKYIFLNDCAILYQNNLVDVEILDTDEISSLGMSIFNYLIGAESLENL